MATMEELEARLMAAEATIEQLTGLPLPQADELTFPVTGYAANMPEWMNILQSFANGVIDHGGSPFRMTADDFDDTITVHLESNTGRNDALIRGLGYRQTEIVKLTVPRVQTQTRFLVGLEFDPAHEGDPTRAIRLVCISLAEWAIRSAKLRFKLMSFDRRPSQLLTEAWAGRQEHRMRLSPRIYATSEGALPTRAEGALWGQSATVGGPNGPWDEYLCIGNSSEQEWVNTSGPTWEGLVVQSARRWPGYGYRPQFQAVSGWIHSRGVFRRDNGAQFTANGEWHLATIPGHRIPGGRFPDAFRWGGAVGIRGGYILVETDGRIIAITGADDNPYTIAIDGLSIPTK